MLSCCSEGLQTPSSWPSLNLGSKPPQGPHAPSGTAEAGRCGGMRAAGIWEESCSNFSQFMARPFPFGEQSLFECDGGLGS